MHTEKITIVTAFFNIGRENWTQEKGYPSYLFRTSEKYFDYFKNLAKLDNEIIVYTSKDFEEKIYQIRAGKPTHVVVVNYPDDYSQFYEKIQEIQKSDTFKKNISPQEILNPEYWSPDYTLLTNLKVHFVKNAIRDNLVSNNTVAWIDFGYCRDIETLNGITEWKYNFETDKVHMFNLKRIPNLTEKLVTQAIYDNNVYIIGGVTIASQEKWIELQKVVYQCQMELLNKNIVDDDQGIYLMSYFKQPDLIKLHNLGKNQWRTLFIKYDKTSKLNFMQKIKKYFNYY